MKKEDAAYFYQLMESYEGLCNYSTLESDKGTETREIQLHTVPDLVAALERVLTFVKSEIAFDLVSK